MSKCEHCGTELIDKCYRCGAPVCCPRCCADTEPRRNGEKMKLSEVLKEDWPSDREIDRIKLIDALNDYRYGKKGVDNFISTMPTWLKRSEG